jgi:signal recognition particle subunit SRP54
MLENLRSSLGAALKKLVGASDVNEELIDSLCKDVQRALLQSDVNVRLVLAITQNLKKRSLEESPPKGLSRKNHIVSILYDELSRLMGYKGELAAQNNQPEEQAISFVPGKLNTVLMFGIQGSGKTTVTSKLARWLTKHGYHVGVVGADTWRPGALTQLKMNCIKINVEVFGDESTKDAPSIVKNGIGYFMDEMKKMYEISKPELILLVIDGTIGQQAYNQAKSFHDTVPVGGIIITKLDGTAKGGGALAASAVTGAKIFFIGNGERIDDLEVFSPTRFVGRLLGMGDIKAILELAKDLEIQADENQSKRVLSGKMTIEDFYAQMESVGKMGFRNIVDNLPGLSGVVKEDQLDAIQGKLEKWRYIIQSMTNEEKKNPEVITDSRRKRIARGSGVAEHDVKDLIKNFNNSKSMIKQSKGRQMQGMLRRMGIG